MVSITKRKISKRQWRLEGKRLRKSYGQKTRTFYRVKNVAGETLQDLSTKSKAKAYKRKIMR